MLNCGLDQESLEITSFFFPLCVAIGHSLSAGIESTGALRTLLVLVPKTFSLSGFPAFIFHLLSVIHVWPWLPMQGNACSVPLWRIRKDTNASGFQEGPLWFLLPPSTGMSYQDVAFSNLSSLFQLSPKIHFCPLQSAWPDITCWMSQSCLT